MLRRSDSPQDSPKTSAGADAARMAEAAAAAAREDWDGALAVWVGCAHAGNARAQAEIGCCFVYGWGVPRDTDLALEWLLLAAKAGDPLGQGLLGGFYFNGEDGAP